MALGPQNHEHVIKTAEEVIDGAIRNSTCLKQSVTIATKLLGINSMQWDAYLAPKYKRAGWSTADWVFDNRDGDFIMLQP